MEIIHLVLGKANPERMNGVNKVVYQLATHQSNAGNAVSVWGITKDLTANYGTRNFKTLLFKSMKNPFALSEELVQAIPLKKGKAVFHIHGGWIPAFSALSAVLKKNSIPFVFTPHGAYNSIAMRRNAGVKWIYFRLFEKPMLKRAAKIHCIGQSEVAGLNSLYRSGKTCLVPYGFELPGNHSDHPYAQGAELIVGFVGRLDIYTKGLDLLLDAFARFNKAHPDSKLWIIGDGSGMKKLEAEIIQKDLTGKVILHGSVFGRKKEQLISRMHVFAHPSRNEGLPSAVLEAAGLGIPCLVSEATNIGETVSRYGAGLVVSDNDSAAIVLALDHFFNRWRSGHLKNMSRNARHMVIQEFNWKKVLKNFETLYA